MSNIIDINKLDKFSDHMTDFIDFMYNNQHKMKAVIVAYVDKNDVVSFQIEKGSAFALLGMLEIIKQDVFSRIETVE